MPDAFVDPNPVLFSLFILYGCCFLVQMGFYWGIFLRVGTRLEGRGTRDEGRGTKDEGRGTKDEGRGTKDETGAIQDTIRTSVSQPSNHEPESSNLDPPTLTLDPDTFHLDPPTLTLDPPNHGVSVVICARNEFHHLVTTLPQILEQDYPLYEVVVVDHASDDDTDVLLSDLAERYKHLKVVTIKRDLNFFTGKKFPLSIGIKSARYGIILLTDADCRPAGNQWIRLMQEAFTGDREIVLGYGAYEKRNGILNALIRFETVQVAIQYLSFAMAGIPYMGVGRNLAYKKSLFYQQHGFISHYRISSGDDDLFINRVARKRNTGVQRDPGSFTYSQPKMTFGKWFTQKRRHVTTGSHYRFWHKLLLGVYSGTQLVFWISLILLLAWKFAWLFVLSVLLLTWISQYIVVGQCMNRLQEKKLIAWIPLLELITPLLQLLILGSNMIVKPRKWK